MTNEWWINNEWRMNKRGMNIEWMMNKWWISDEWMTNEWWMNNEWMINEWMNEWWMNDQWMINLEMKCVLPEAWVDTENSLYSELGYYIFTYVIVGPIMHFWCSCDPTRTIAMRFKGALWLSVIIVGRWAVRHIRVLCVAQRT